MKPIIESSIKYIAKKTTKDVIKQRQLSNFFMNMVNMIDVRSTINRKISLKHDFKEYKKISKKYKIYNKEWYFPNNYYGIANNLYKYSGYNSEIKGCIEHGLMFGSNVLSKFEVNNNILPAMITLSDYRKKYLEKVSNKLIFKIGPYIHYAKDFYDNKNIIEEKIKNGKTLLVFPSHSIDNVYSNYDINKFIEKLKDIHIYYNFSTVFICLYWADIKNGLDNIYKKHGFNVVTAGYREDPMFLSRLKTLINLSDYTVSNNVGTHIGYCIYLKKPHYIIKQDIKLSSRTKKDYLFEFKDRDLNSYKSDTEEIFGAFAKITPYITQDQVEICNKYWGFNEIKSQDQIRYILEFCDYLFNTMHSKNKKIDHIVEEYIVNNQKNNNVQLIIDCWKNYKIYK